MTAVRHIKRFKGAWASGFDFEAGDIVALGRWSYEALKDHVSGPQSQPAHGVHWPQFWDPVDGFGQAPRAPEPTPLPAPAVYALPAMAPGVNVIQLPVPADRAATPGMGTPATGPVAGQVPPVPAPLAPASPAVVPKASEIEDDSDAGGLNVAHSLSLLRGAVAAREQDQAGLQQRLVDLAERLGTEREPADPIERELARRKLPVLGVETLAEVNMAEQRVLRRQVGLLRKRDLGRDYTAADAAAATICDEIFGAIARLEEAADALAHSGATDIEDDRHWPQLGAPS